MINYDEINITDAVNARLADCQNPRLKQLVSGLTRHLHDFAREVALTEQEWEFAIQYLTETGKMCNDKRQEFILLSDVLGMSMLTVLLNNRKPQGATESTVFGPFHVENAPWYDNGDDISNGAAGQPCFASGTVRDMGGAPIANAVLDVWHSDEDGFYDVQYPHDKLAGRGRLRADENGNFNFRTIKPVAYPIPTDGPVGRLLQGTSRHPWRPAHIHFMVAAEGYSTLITHVFDKTDPYLKSDAVFGVRSSLLGDYQRHEAGEAAPDGTIMGEPFYTMQYDLIMTKPMAPEPALVQTEPQRQGGQRNG